MPTLDVSEQVKDELDRIKDAEGHRSYDSVVRSLLGLRRMENGGIPVFCGCTTDGEGSESGEARHDAADEGEPEYRNREWLHRQYRVLKRSQREIAEECGVDQATIAKWLDKHGIEAADPAALEAELRDMFDELSDA